MTVRALDSNGDWIFGIGKNAYLSGNAEVAQAIQTRLLSFLGDCFFDVGAGIDWFSYLGGKDQIGLNLAISAVILNTANVTGIRQLLVNLDDVTRKFTVQYQVQTTYSVLSGTFQYDLNGSVT
jgi:hypothetical protein